MNSAPLIDFGNPPARPPVRVLTHRPMILPQADGKPGHTPTGTEITLDAAVLDRLSGADVIVIAPVPPALAFEI